MGKVFDAGRVNSLMEELNSFLTRVSELQQNVMIVDERLSEIRKRYVKGVLSKNSKLLIINELSSERDAVVSELNFCIQSGVDLLEKISEYVKLQKM